MEKEKEYKKYDVLDHGFIRVIDKMGDDISITQAARVSYGDGTKGVSQDASLIRYLLRNNHTSPFEMCEIKLHIKCPIFIARQWLRHRTASVNEYSGRYSIMREDYYLPATEQLKKQSMSNKQGRGENLSPENEKRAQEIIRETSEHAIKQYNALLALGEEGLARELARIILPLNLYTEFYWKIDLHNLLHFVELRADSHAQYEIREYANVMLEILKEWLPITYQAFMDYRINKDEGKAK